jgi:hypothetical protein
MDVGDGSAPPTAGRFACASNHANRAAPEDSPCMIAGEA